MAHERIALSEQLVDIAIAMGNPPDSMLRSEVARIVLPVLWFLDAAYDDHEWSMDPGAGLPTLAQFARAVEENEVNG